MNRFSPALRAVAVAVLFAFCFTMMMPADAAAANKKQTATTFVQGTNANGDVFSGVMTINNFAQQGNQLVAQGVLNGTLTPNGGTPQTVTNLPFSAPVPVSSISASCSILSLVLGPLNLDILGLQITLNQVILNIVAQSGAGNLLGNLLCDVANLLNGGNLGNLLGQLVGLLNNILAALNL